MNECEQELLIKSIDPQLVLWDASTGKQKWSVTTELHELRSIAFSPDGALLALATSSTVSRCGTLETAPCCARSMVTYRRSLPSLSHVAGCSQARVRMVRFDSGTPRQDARSEGCPSTRSVAEDGSVCLWNAVSGGRERALTGLRSRGTCVAFSPDGALVVAGSAGKNRGRR